MSIRRGASRIYRRGRLVMARTKIPQGNLPHPKKLSDTHRYLLSLVPNEYRIRPAETPEPKDIAIARRKVDVWEKAERKRSDKFMLEYRIRRRAVIDAIYFKEPTVARAMVERLRIDYDVKEN
jgi:hypothetical protein